MGKYKHGFAKKIKRPVEYNIWKNMRQRCFNPNHPAYPYYGGRGILIDSSWGDFAKFLEDVGPRPGIEYTLDRINNNKGYSKNNCRWATKSTQMLNTRTYKNSPFNERGITKDRNKYRVRLTFFRKTCFIGNFDCLEDAIKARNDFLRLRDTL